MAWKYHLSEVIFLHLVLKVMADFSLPSRSFLHWRTYLTLMLTMNNQRMLQYAALSCDHNGDTTV